MVRPGKGGDLATAHGEAIYETTHWSTFGEGPTSVSTGHVSESKDKPFTADDLRFTARGDVLYVTGLKWPDDHKVSVKTLASGGEHFPEAIGSVMLLGHESPVHFSRDEDGLHVELPTDHPSEFAYVLKVTK
ncbi:MAG: alpha-L-fucosidase C-terminal domain-containing protein [Planctomycetota bacterium]